MSNNNPNTAYAILGRVVESLNSQGRNLVLRDEHEKVKGQEHGTIVIRIRENDAYKLGPIPIWPKKGEIVQEFYPYESGVDWANLGFHQTIDALKSYTRDTGLQKELEAERSHLIASLSTI